MNCDYYESMRTSAEQLDQVRDLGLGFTWKDVARPLPTRLPEEFQAFLSSSSRQELSGPVTLSSTSSSDTEDDIPLSSRVKRPKVQLHDDVSAQTPVRAEKEQVTAGLTEVQPTTKVQPVQSGPASSSKATNTALPKTAKPESSERPQNAAPKAEDGAQDTETAQEAIPTSKAQTARKQSKEQTKPVKRGQQAGKKAKQKETVIDLEAESEPEFEFTTGLKPQPRNSVGLKKLQKENPKLYEALLRRYVTMLPVGFNMTPTVGIFQAMAFHLCSRIMQI